MSILDPNAKELVSNNFMVFTEFLRRKTVPMIKYLFDEQILEVKDAEKSISQAAATMKACHLLDNMVKEPLISFEKMYAATLYVKAWKAADVLEPVERPHQQRDEEPPMPLPDKWPSTDQYEELKSRQINLQTVESTDERMIKYYNRSTKFNIYEMNKKWKGRALIINNSKFESKNFPERKGSEHDRDGLKTLLTKLGLRVEIHENKTKDEMVGILQREASFDHSDFQCFFLFILSHGSEGVVYGTDGMSPKNGEEKQNFITIETIRNLFERVKSLQRKPKVLIIQACQGGDTDLGVTTTGTAKEKAENDLPQETEADAPEMEEVATPDAVQFGNSENSEEQEEQEEPGNSENTEEQEEEEKAEEGGEGEEDEEGEEDKDDDDKFKLLGPIDDPKSKFNTSLSLTDDEPYHVLIALPTTPGNLSFRDINSGSWFIQAFIFVLTKYAYKEHLITLMEKVNKLVSKATAKTGKKKMIRSKQASQTKHTFLKKFYFFPGMPLDNPLPKPKQSFDFLMNDFYLRR